MKYTQFNKYKSLLEDFSKEESKQVIDDMLTRYNIDRTMFIQYDMDINENNILNYISCLEILDYVYINKFIDYIFNIYINHYKLLELIVHLPIIENKINNHLKNKVCDIKFIKYLIANKFKITNLEIDNRFTDDDIKSLTDLTYLDLSYDIGDKCIITDKGIRDLTNLTTLKIGRKCTITDEGIKGLTNLTTLNFEIGHSNITDEGIKHLTNLTDLELNNDFLYPELFNNNPHYVKITYNGLKYLTKLKKLSLNSYNKIYDEGFIYLINLTSLDLVNVTVITNYGITYLTNLIELKLVGFHNITDEGIKHLTKLTKLKLKSNVWVHRHITDEGIKHLTNLTDLDISICDRITIEGIKHLTKLTKLKISHGNEITPDIVNYLPNLVITQY